MDNLKKISHFPVAAQLKEYSSPSFTSFLEGILSRNLGATSVFNSVRNYKKCVKC